MRNYRLILASNSPRRRELLTQAGYRFEVVAPEADVECGVCSETGPGELVAELAFRKATAVREKLQRHGERETSRPRGTNEVIVAADTVAECDGMILGKPRNEADARAMLRQLRGRKHRVLTGVCVWPIEHPYPSPLPAGEGTEPLVRVAITELRMDNLSDAAIDDYIATGHWEGKAGGFGYQDRLGWVHVERGSESNVVGMPMELLAEMLVEVDGR